MGYFQVRYDSRVVNYDRKGFIRLATDIRSLNLHHLHQIAPTFSVNFFCIENSPHFCIENSQKRKTMNALSMFDIYCCKKISYGPAKVYVLSILDKK